MYNVTFVGGPLDGQTKTAQINYENKTGQHLLEGLVLTITLDGTPQVYQFKDGGAVDVRFEHKP